MASTGSISDKKIAFSFVWKGPANRDNGKTFVGVVDFIFNNAKSKFSVKIPEEIEPKKPIRLQFDKRKDLMSKKCDLLVVTCDQVKNLTIKAGYFEECFKNNINTTDSKADKENSERDLLRMDGVISFETPELEMGQRYRLVVTSNELLHLQAQFIKESV